MLKSFTALRFWAPIKKVVRQVNSMLLGKFRRGKFTQMIEKVVNNRNLKDFSSIREDLDYWLSKTPEERVAAVDYLRRQYLSWKYS